MYFSKSFMPEKSLQVTRLRLVTWKDISGIRDLEKPILALPPHWIGSLWRQGSESALVSAMGSTAAAENLVAP